MDQDRPQATSADDGTVESELDRWYHRIPWKRIGLVGGVLLVWLIIGLACPPHLWRF